MENKKVQIGEKYVAKVSGRLTVVRILELSRYGGWEARNEKTGRRVHIRSGRKLRRKFTTSSLSFTSPLQGQKEQDNEKK